MPAAFQVARAAQEGPPAKPLSTSPTLTWEGVTDGAVAVAWSDAHTTNRLSLIPSVRAYDIMGNPLPDGVVRLDQSPVYLVNGYPGDLVNVLKP